VEDEPVKAEVREAQVVSALTLGLSLLSDS
jgi:hypothetical protein